MWGWSKEEGMRLERKKLWKVEIKRKGIGKERKREEKGGNGENEEGNEI